MAGSKRIKKILIANRGEIAVRIINTCKKYGIETVAIYSEADKTALHVQKADSAFFIGPSPSQESYLCAKKIVDVAKLAKVDAIHPGYGFLSENAEFAKLCIENSIIWIGPSPEAIEVMGSKIGAKELLKNKNVPLIPGTTGGIENEEEIRKIVEKIGFPVLLKASAGGGGKGMRVIHDLSGLSNGIVEAKNEALSSFGDASLLLEKYFTNVKHIEVQIIGDTHGNVSNLLDRECSVQRRHQKIIEEAPSPSISHSVRKKLLETAEIIGKSINYYSLGTVEFIYDCESQEFYFLEVNTRLQVEHPVTEFITNFDLVLLQIRIAEGHSLTELGIPTNGELIQPIGHSIECRLCSEDPLNNFFPSIGKILHWEPSNMIENSNYVRFDCSISSGSEISIFYDPMIAKIICWAENRADAVLILTQLLKHTVILGVSTNKEFLSWILNHPSFVDSSFATNFIDRFFPTNEILKIHSQKINDFKDLISIAAFVKDWKMINDKRTLLSHLPSGWRNNRSNSFSDYQVKLFIFSSPQGGDILLKLKYKINSSWRKSQFPSFEVEIENQEYSVELVSVDGVKMNISVNGHLESFAVVNHADTFYIHSNYGNFTLQKRSRLYNPEDEVEEISNNIISPMPARILQLLVNDGDAVTIGQPLLVVESMKMQSTSNSPKDGQAKVFVKVGDLVDAGTILMSVE